MVEVGPPRLMAHASDGRQVMTDANLMSLPSSDCPALTVFEDADGRWQLETDEGNRVLHENESVVIGDVSWTIYLPTASNLTQDADRRSLTLRAITLELSVSRDQEFVAVRLCHPQGEIELEARAHAQLLLALGHARLRDREQGLAESECGWIHREDLCRELDIELSLINLWVHRARQQLDKVGIRDAGNIVERRHGTLQLRIGIEHCIVRRA